MKIAFIILGQPCSKANSRRLVNFGKRPAFVKSREALAYERDARIQIPFEAKQMLMVPVRVTMRIYYASERPDLDESLILDCLQPQYKGKGKARTMLRKGVILNDRQVREKHIYHGIDRVNPRAEIEIEPIAMQQQGLIA